MQEVLGSNPGGNIFCRRPFCALCVCPLLHSVRRATRSDRQHRGGRVFSNTVQVDVVMSNHAAGAASPDPGSVGECLVGRHVPGVAVDRCASFGVVRAGSVLLPGLGVVGRWVGHDS
eukprot:scaffold16011_cov126-Isochrysis_galbana.AAC.2